MQPQQPQKLNEPETFEQSLQLLLDGVQIAQKRGAYNLQESALLYKAILKVQEQFSKKVEEKVEEI